MDLKQFRSILGWCVVINFGLLIFITLLFVIAKEWIFNMWSIFYTIPYEAFDIIMISIVGIWKIIVFVFFLVPYIAIGRVLKEK